MNGGERQSKGPWRGSYSVIFTPNGSLTVHSRVIVVLVLLESPLYIHDQGMQGPPAQRSGDRNRHDFARVDRFDPVPSSPSGCPRQKWAWIMGIGLPLRFFSALGDCLALSDGRYRPWF